MSDTPIVRPRRGRRSPSLGPLAVMVSNTADLVDLCRAWAPLGGLPERPLFNSRLFCPQPGGACAVGPVIGAPLAVMLLETLTAWGARRLLYFGWCGALSDALAVGDVLVPDRAIIDEGTSPAYGAAAGSPVCPDGRWTETVRQAVVRAPITLHAGAVWTTDAVFRETPSRVAHFVARGAVAVEMEVSALCSAARACGVEMAAVLAVSDSLSSGRWQPGFTSSALARTRRFVCERIGALMQASGPVTGGPRVP